MYELSVFIHILAAIFWIGGMLFTAAVLVPVSRESILNSRRGEFFKITGQKFSRISWVLFLILFITGIINLTTRGIQLQALINLDFWKSSFGLTLAYKLSLFGFVAIISALHDFYAGPKAAALLQTKPNDTATQSFRKLSSWLGRLNLVLGLGILYCAIILVRG